MISTLFTLISLSASLTYCPRITLFILRVIWISHMRFKPTTDVFAKVVWPQKTLHGMELNVQYYKPKIINITQRYESSMPLNKINEMYKIMLFTRSSLGYFSFKEYLFLMCKKILVSSHAIMRQPMAV